MSPERIPCPHYHPSPEASNNVICGLRLSLVLSLALRIFFPVTPGITLSKTNKSNSNLIWDAAESLLNEPYEHHTFTIIINIVLEL